MPAWVSVKMRLNIEDPFRPRKNSKCHRFTLHMTQDLGRTPGFMDNRFCSRTPDS